MAPGASGKWHVLYPARSEGEVLDDAVQFRMGRPDGWNVPLHAVWHGQSLSLDRPRCRSGLSLPDRPWPDLQAHALRRRPFAKRSSADSEIGRASWRQSIVAPSSTAMT